MSLSAHTAQEVQDLHVDTKPGALKCSFVRGREVLMETSAPRDRSNHRFWVLLSHSAQEVPFVLQDFVTYKDVFRDNRQVSHRPGILGMKSLP